eukprot:6195794-Pleurochrysis_carterae.AAC.3
MESTLLRRLTSRWQGSRCERPTAQANMSDVLYAFRCSFFAEYPSSSAPLLPFLFPSLVLHPPLIESCRISIALAFTIRCHDSTPSHFALFPLACSLSFAS